MPTFAYATAHFFLGAALWVSGQSNDLISVTGLGYLVVFDSLGPLNEVLSQWVSIAKKTAERKAGWQCPKDGSFLPGEKCG